MRQWIKNRRDNKHLCVSYKHALMQGLASFSGRMVPAKLQTLQNKSMLSHNRCSLISILRIKIVDGKTVLSQVNSIIMLYPYRAKDHVPIAWRLGVARFNIWLPVPPLSTVPRVSPRATHCNGFGNLATTWYKIPLRTSVQSLNTKSLALALKHCHKSRVNCKTDSQIWASASLNYPFLRNQKLEPSNYLFVVFCPQFSVVKSLVFAVPSK